MAGFFKKALDYLGLDDDEYGDYDPYEEQPAMRRAPAAPEAEPGPAAVFPRSSGSSSVTVTTQHTQSGGITVAPANVGTADTGVGSVAAQSRAGSPVVRTINPTKTVKVHVAAPASFAEAQEIGERFRTGQPVVIDLRDTEREAAKRLVDFSSGLAYALHGEIKKTEDRVFLIRPNGVDVPADEQRRLRDAGLMR